MKQGKLKGVTLGDGHCVAIRGKCRGMEVQLGMFLTKVDGFVFELGNLDMILGGGLVTEVW